MRKYTAILAIFLFFIKSNIHSQNQKFAVEKFTLENGLTVYLNEDHNQSKVYGAIAVKAGGKYDPKDATGMGHYLEHMLFKGTTELGTSDFQSEKKYLDQIYALYDSLGLTKDEDARKEIQKKINEASVKAAKFAIPNEFDRLMGKIGASGVNAFTDYEQIVYHNFFPPNQIEKWLDIFSHRLQKPVFRLFQSELEVVYEEKNRGSDTFIWQIYENFMKNFFKNHPYGQQTIIGTKEHLKNPSLTKMYDYFETYYVPNNMALVIVGDFDTKKVKPLIEKKFGVLKKKTVPKYPKYLEKAFSGREYVKMKLSPVGMGVMGFRAPTTSSKDKIAFELCNYILSNENETGLLDELVLDDELMEAQLLYFPYNDHGGSGIILVPKILKSVKKAEKMVLAQLEKLRKGEFSDKLLQSAKISMKKNFALDNEDLKSRALNIVDTYISGGSWDEFQDFPNQLDKISKEKIMEIAAKYYGSNYLMFHSKMGFPKKDRVEKPGFDPVIPEKDKQSNYAKYFDKLPEGEIPSKSINFSEAVEKTKIQENATLYHVKNPYNDIFSLEIKFHYGKIENPKLELLAAYMNLIGTKNQSAKDLKSTFSDLGAYYSFSSNNDYFTISIDGFDEKLDKVVEMLAELLNSPKLDEKKLQIAVNQILVERKIEDNQPNTQISALLEKILYGEQSSYRKRLSKKELNSTKIEELQDALNQVLGMQVDFHYAGNLSSEKVSQSLKKLQLGDLKSNKAPIVRDRQNYDENVIYFVDKKDALQSHIYFYIDGKKFAPSDYPSIQAFNQYFGGDMSSLVFQEIREFRSLAYSARAYYKSSYYKNMKSIFYAYLGTQADKSNEAFETMWNLIIDMPKKLTRLDAVKSALSQSVNTEIPSFRYLSSSVMKWESQGFEQVPSFQFKDELKEIKWNDIIDFYKENIIGKPIVVMIVGNYASVDLEQLVKFAEVKLLTEKDILKK